MKRETLHKSENSTLKMKMVLENHSFVGLDSIMSSPTLHTHFKPKFWILNLFRRVGEVWISGIPIFVKFQILKFCIADFCHRMYFRSLSKMFYGKNLEINALQNFTSSSKNHFWKSFHQNEALLAIPHHR